MFVPSTLIESGRKSEVEFRGDATRSASVLSSLSFNLLVDIHPFTSDIQFSRFLIRGLISLRGA